MLGESDNMLAESLVREVGRRAGAATAEAGTAAISRAVVDRLCVPATGVNADGSGISRADRQSATTLRRLLQAVDETPAATTFRAGLAQAGRTGTLQRRLAGPVTAGRVWAKTGTLDGTRALAGYALTPSGREVVFAVLANGDDAALSNAAIDDLVTRVLVALG
jgi:D-alanyl-D-alanine carboxypeptidase/D-alanyl-D-alanine-endopeptidase (penicillin-binding protein 4)